MHNFFVRLVGYSLYKERIIFSGDNNYLGTMQEQYPSHDLEDPLPHHNGDAVLRAAITTYEQATQQLSVHGIENSLIYYENAANFFNGLLNGSDRQSVINNEDFHIHAAEIQEELANFYLDNGNYTKEQALIAYDGAMFHFNEASRVILGNKEQLSEEDALLGRITLKQANLSHDFGFTDRADAYVQRHIGSELYGIEESAWLHGQQPESD